MNDDTIQLLKECNSGSQMAIDSIDQLLEHCKNDELKTLLSEYKSEHEKIRDRSQSLLFNSGEDGKKPGIIASAMSWLTSEMKMNMNGDANQIAKIMMDGCNMGIQTIGEDINKYEQADSEAKEIARELIRSEEEFNKKMENFL